MDFAFTMVSGHSMYEGLRLGFEKMLNLGYFGTGRVRRSLHMNMACIYVFPILQ